MNWIRERNLERIFLLLVGTVLAFLFMKLFSILRKDFENTPKGLSEGRMINLNDAKPGEHMRSLLTTGFYFEDPKDIQLAGQIVTQGFTNNPAPVENIGALNKRQFNVSTETAFLQGGESYKKRALLSRALIGFVGDDSLRFEQEKKAPPVLSPFAAAGMGNYTITGSVVDTEEKPVQAVLVRLQMILPRDSLYSIEVTEVEKIITENSPAIKKVYVLDSMNHRQLQSMSVFVRTDVNGKFSFTGLPGEKAFEILPLNPGFEFGTSKGVQRMEKDVSFTFYQKPHTIRLFSNRDFNNLKKDKALLVRTPEEVIQWIWIIAGCFFGAFLFLHVLLTIRFPKNDPLILPVVMLMTGISFLTLLSLQDPLRDRFLAQSTLWYFMGGIAGICLLLFFDLRRFTTDARLFRMFAFKENKKAANGWPWAIAAVVLLMLTIFFGTGPEGSGVKVNLFGFQPSEIVKFLLLLFLAGFFTTNEKFISEYARWQKRWSFFSFALVSIVGCILLFLVLGDLGPAMVLCFTFIILFSFSRGDFVFTVATAVVYVLSIWLLKNIWLATLVVICLLFLSAFFIKKGLSESAIMVIVVMAGFLLLDKIPSIEKIFPGPVQRLAERKAIWQNPWNNEVFGGDHIANSIWGMASGGIQGQGIGEGFAKTIPEAHTDMILPSIGEELGWAGILSIFILFLIFLHRAIVIGRQTGRSFLFYLCAGMGISTFIQFLLIAGGSIGALPLSGVSLPFISYGGSSLILNMLAAGFLLSVSGVSGSTVQLQYLSRQQDKNLLPALIAALVGIVLLGINVSQYLFNNKKWVVQPALVVDRSGSRQFSYNPRIAILMNRLGAGNLLDRNGKLLATGKPDLILKHQDSLLAAGLDKNYLATLSHKRLDRYYPFAEQMFFWTGDANNGIFMGSTNGYFAEYEHIAELRGFSTPSLNFNVVASHFREDHFLPEISTEMSITKKDYSVLSPLLLAGINSGEVEKFKQRNRDVQLTMDAALQTEIQQSLQTIDSLKNSRISVVILEDSSGDVLTSAAFPLPTINEPEKLTLTIGEQNKLPYWITNSDLGFTHASQPGSSAKLVTALAAFNKLGVAAKQKTILVRPGDLIRVKGEEPDEAGNISIERAIIRSNNPFFIRLANEERLEEEMGTLYLQSGMFLHGAGGYYYDGDMKNEIQQNKWRALWRNTEFKSVRSYNPDNIRRTRGRGVSGMAWGQGELISSPAAIARIAAGISNKGVLVPNRYVLKVSDSAFGVKEGVTIVRDAESADLMTKYMKEQSAGKYHRLGIYVAGKTGTPERIVKGERINDGWYVFFAPKANGTGHIVTCIRIENCKGSSVAVRLAGAQIIPILLRRGYIKSFGTGKHQVKAITNAKPQ